MERITPCPGATAALAAGLADVVCEGDVVLLEGELGSGKTTFVRALASALRCDVRAVSSPTFVVVNVYEAQPIRGDSPRRVVHVDAYRLHSAEDVDALGWDAIVQQGRAAPGTVLLVEWAQRIADALPPQEDCAHVTLRATGEHTRSVTLSLPRSWSSRAGYALFMERQPVVCRATGAWVSPTSPTYPFADRRSKDADLHKWFSGAYNISRPIRADDETDPDVSPHA